MSQAGRSAAPCEVAAQRLSSASTPAVAPARTVPPAIAISTWTRLPTPLRAARRRISGPEALLGLHRHDLRACQRGPDGEEPAVGAEVEHPAGARHGAPSAQVHVPAVHLARPGGVSRGKRDHRPARGPETRSRKRQDPVGGDEDPRARDPRARGWRAPVSQRAAKTGRACRHGNDRSAAARRAARRAVPRALLDGGPAALPATRPRRPRTRRASRQKRSPATPSRKPSL